MINILLSFDDGRKDNYMMAKQILEPLSIPATFNITAGYIQKKIKKEDMPSMHEPMDIEDLKDLANNELFEIAGHGYKHNNDIENLIEGVKVLRNILPEKYKSKMGIVSPSSRFDVNIIEGCIDKFKKNNIVYLRTGKRSNKLLVITLAKRVIRKINKYLHIPLIYSWIYNESFIKKEDNFIVYSIGIYKYNKLKEVKKIIQNAIKRDKSYIFTFHSILKPGEDFYEDLYTWDYNDFYELCIFLKALEN